MKIYIKFIRANFQPSQKVKILSSIQCFLENPRTNEREKKNIQMSSKFLRSLVFHTKPIWTTVLSILRLILLFFIYVVRIVLQESAPPRLRIVLNADIIRRKAAGEKFSEAEK